MAGKILVAEDDPEARELLVLLLGSGGYDLLEAQDGVAALELLRDARPDLLITDIVMPRMDGYELVRRLRQDERIARMPVIFCSASYHEREVRAMAQSLGVFTLSKPFDVEAVHAAVSAALASRSAARTADRAPGWAASATSDRESLQATRARLDALVDFSRRLFAQVDSRELIDFACRAARAILLAQCAELVVLDRGALERRACASGLPEDETRALLSAPLYRELTVSLAQGGIAAFPLSAIEGAGSSLLERPGTLVSMLAVPVASRERTYGYLSVINRIGLSAFNEQDVAVARAIATQVAVAYENACRHETLEHLVAERTAALKVANRELEAFTYSVAHDLRAPLRLMDAHAQMAREAAGAASPAINHISQIQRGAVQMSALIDGLLALSRVSHIEMKREPIALESVARLAVQKVAHEARGRTIHWSVGQLPIIVGDPDLMLQAFVNLLSNAAKYTRGKPEAQIEVGLGSDARATYVYVRDNGVGFDMRYAGKLFGVFQRLHRQDQFEGTGIGLATVARIIERHGGRIWAEGHVGQGAVFRFTVEGLPLL